MIRKIGKQGTVTLPKAVRVTAGLHAGMAVQVETQGRAICITAAKECCHLCGSPDNVKKAAGIKICRRCADKIMEVMENDTRN